MTTIAWDGKTLASDTQSNSGDMIVATNTRKIFTPKSGELWTLNGKNVAAFGLSGSNGAEFDIIKKLISGIDHDTEFSSVINFAAMCITKD